MTKIQNLKLINVWNIEFWNLGFKLLLFAAQAVYSGCSVARLSRLLWEQEVAGSNPATPTRQNPFERSSRGFFGFRASQARL